MHQSDLEKCHPLSVRHFARFLSANSEWQIQLSKYRNPSHPPPTLTGAASAFRFRGKMSHIVGQLGTKIRWSISPGSEEQLLNEANLATLFKLSCSFVVLIFIQINWPLATNYLLYSAHRKATNQLSSRNQISFCQKLLRPRLNFLICPTGLICFVIRWLFSIFLKPVENP